MPKPTEQSGAPASRPNLPNLRLTELPAGSHPTNQTAFWIEGVKGPAFTQGAINTQSATIEIGMIHPSLFLIMSRKFAPHVRGSSNDRSAPMELYDHQGKTGVIVTPQKFNQALPIRVTMSQNEWVQLRASPDSPIILIQFRDAIPLNPMDGAMDERHIAVYQVTCDFPGPSPWLSVRPLI